MASTYVNNLRLNELATGDGSGTWGTTTNTNLELIGQALGWGTRAIANASADNITIADGASDADRNMALKLTGGGQACTVTILPNTSSKVWIMENATAATLTFTAGSGANVAILAGETKMIATDGGGSGGVVYDVLTDLSLAGTTTAAALTVAGTVDATTVEFNNLSGTSAVNVTDIADEDNMSSNSATKLATQQSIKAYVDAQVDTADTLTEVLAIGNTTATNQKIQFRDAAIHISSSADGQLDLVADTEIQIAATTIDINGAVLLSADLTVGDDLTVNGGVIELRSDSGAVGQLKLYCETSNNHAQTISPQAHSVAATNTLTLPGGSTIGNSNATLVSDTGTQTLTNKSLTAPTITGTAVTAAITAGGDITRGGTVIGDGSITDTGDYTLDIVGDIILDADGDNIFCKAAGTSFYSISNVSGDVYLGVEQSDKDLLIRGNDGGNVITALTLDMSDAGAATFNSDIILADGKVARFGNSQDFRISFDTHGILQNVTSDSDVLIRGNDGGNVITALTLDMSAAGAATFSNDVTAFSDERLKSNITTIPDALSKVTEMRGVHYVRNETGKDSTGVIAQELQKIAPELVLTAEDEMGTLSVNYGNITGYLIEAIKELKAEIEELKAR